MQFILNDCFYGDLFYNGRDAKTPMPLALKMENLLGAVYERRQLVLEKLRKCRKLDPCSEADNYDSSHYIAEQDMRDMYNNWRTNVYAWMHTSNSNKYEDLKKAGNNRDAHALSKKAFSKYLFQLSGDKFLLQMLIQLPLVQDPNSARSPVTSQQFRTSLARFITELRRHYKDERYKDAANKPRRCSAEYIQLTKQILLQVTRDAAADYSCYSLRSRLAALDLLLSERAGINRETPERVILTPRRSLHQEHPHNT